MEGKCPVAAGSGVKSVHRNMKALCLRAPCTVKYSDGYLRLDVGKGLEKPGGCWEAAICLVISLLHGRSCYKV